jgi:hypothetical protein
LGFTSDLESFGQFGRRHKQQTWLPMAKVGPFAPERHGVSNGIRNGNDSDGFSPWFSMFVFPKIRLDFFFTSNLFDV